MAPMSRRLSPLRWLALALAGLGLVSWAFARPIVVDARSGAPPADAFLERPLAYVLLSPVTSLLDHLSLLALSQHIAFLVSLLMVFWVWRGWRRPPSRTWGRAAVVETLATVAFLAGLVGLYAVMTYVPRPVPRLRVEGEGLLVIDFHSHTRHSHDVPEGYGVEWNRRTHERVGFHAAYLTDHAGWAGVPEGAAANPARAGDGFVLLTASELWLGGENTLALGDSSLYRGTLDERGIGIEPGRGPVPHDPPATLILTLPARRPLEAVGFSPSQPWGLVGLEVNDASPKGLEQGRRTRSLLLQVADREDLAVVSATNNHGAGRTAAAWTLMELPGWRALSPSALALRIESTLHRDRGRATRVVERTLPFPRPYALVAFTAVALPWHTAATLSLTERLVWLLYAAGLWIVGSPRKGRASGPQRPLPG
ncbi:MAG: hypothetical protein R3E10_15405 [Gemmatimonadota bacterium]